MLRAFATILILVLAVGIAPTWADQISGKVQKVDTADRAVVLEDGTQLWVADSISMEALKEGVTIKASYEDKEGKKIITEIEVTD